MIAIVTLAALLWIEDQKSMLHGPAHARITAAVIIVGLGVLAEYVKYRRKAKAGAAPRRPAARRR